VKVVSEDEKNKPRSAAAIARWEREKAQQRAGQRQALELRQLGYSYRQIAELQNISVRSATLRCKKAAQRDIPTELVETVRNLELDRLDTITTMNLKLMQKAYEAGDVESFCKLQDRVHAVHDRRKKMVPIEVPTRLVVDQNTTVQTDQDRELAEMLANKAQEVEDTVRWLTEQTQG